MKKKLCELAALGAGLGAAAAVCGAAAGDPAGWLWALGLLLAADRALGAARRGKEAAACTRSAKRRL